ncbi:hypothetical protein [Sphingomonas radiodurans]|uniref:hypothetical protein n=1 Tax=Sphingomonas radiodurans TaxID=2890321 RepID=UPI001E6502BA|nr:hypothetical protein [Sphingomonas radiodurans]WBH17051.1 hypothetical protein LLW23_02715 [Sphingomonas radiodurans]
MKARSKQVLAEPLIGRFIKAAVPSKRKIALSMVSALAGASVDITRLVGGRSGGNI